MEASRLRTLMKFRLLLPAIVFFSLFLLVGVNGYAVPPACANMGLGNGAPLNGFIPFSPSDPWNTNISGAPVDSNSKAIIAEITGNSGHSLGGSPSPLHPDFGPDNGIPYVIVDSNVQPFVNMVGLSAGPITPDQSYASQSDAVVEPAPITAPIEGDQPDCLEWPQSAYYFGDTHMLVVDRNQCWLYETYLTSRCEGVYTAGGQALWDLQNGEQRPWGWTSTDAAGLPVFVGLVKYDEAAAALSADGSTIIGSINHAFRFTLANTKGDGNIGYFVHPATHAAAPGYKYANENIMGMRMRLKPSTDISSYSPLNQVLLTAMMNYGLILADNGGNMYVSGAPDARWSIDDLGNWHGGPHPIHATDFEVLQMDPEGVNPNPTEPAILGEVGAAASYMDANSAPYTVADVEAGIYPGGLGPMGTTLTGAGNYPTDGPTGVTNLGAPVPVINSFGATYGSAQNACANAIASGTAVTFAFNITGSSYSYIDNAGPVRVSGTTGTLIITPRETQTYMLYSMNSYGMAISTPCTIQVAGSTLPVPVLSPSTGTYSTIINVVITEPGYPDATIYYTTDGSTPAYPVAGTTMTYTGPINISSTVPLGYLPGEQINAIAVVPDFPAPSEVAGANYTVNSAALAPVISPDSGTYATDNTPLTVTISDATVPIDNNFNANGDSVIIYYTTDGTTPGGDANGNPTGTSMVNFGSPFTINLPTGTTTVKAAAIALGYTLSPVTTATYSETENYFTVTVAPTALTINPGSNAGSVSVTVTGLGGYTGTVNLTCSGVPPGDSCTLNPTSVSITAGAPTAVSALTIGIGLNAANHNNSFPLLPGGATLAVALCFFGLRKRRRLQMLLLLAVSVVGLSLFTGCGTPGSVPNTVTVTITGTDSHGLATVNSYLTLTQMQRQ
jgi:hypothetical protein